MSHEPQRAVDGDAGAAPGELHERPARYGRSDVGRTRILLVEDDALGRRASARALALDYAVTAVSSGEAALTCLTREPFDIVLTDHYMPVMTGLELLGHVRGHDPRVRRVLMSGAEIAGIERYLDSGLIELWIEKPADLPAALGGLPANVSPFS